MKPIFSVSGWEGVFCFALILTVAFSLGMATMAVLR